MSDSPNNTGRELQTAALIEVTRANAALQAGLSGVLAKVEAVREMFLDHKTNTSLQFTRIDNRMDTLTQDQRAIDTKVDKWQVEAKGLIEEAIRLGQSTQAAVKALDPPVARWREMESRLKNGRWIAGLLGAAIVWIITHFWPVVEVMLHAHTAP